MRHTRMVCPRVYHCVRYSPPGYGMFFGYGKTYSSSSMSRDTVWDMWIRLVWDTVYTPTSLYRQVIPRSAPHTIPPYRFFGFGSGGGELRAGTNGGYFHTRCVEAEFLRGFSRSSSYGDRGERVMIFQVRLLLCQLNSPI